MILTEKLPVSLRVKGREYQIQTDFRKVLDYEEHVKPDAEDRDIILAVFEMYKRNTEILKADIFPEAMEKLNWFISCGEEQKKRPSNAVLGINRNRPFDFKVDGGLIYSAFVQTYEMDLYEVEYMHWWKFNALLADISKDCRFSKVMEYRTIDLKNKNLSKDQKKLYSALQSYYKIAESKSQEEKDFVKALLEGRDPMKQWQRAEKEGK